MNTDRIREIQTETPYSNSHSVQQALLKVWNECEQDKPNKKPWLSLLYGWRKQIKQQNKAIKRKNNLIHRLRYDNPHYRKWCWLYGTDPKVNPWVKNTGALPEKMPHDAWIDIKRNNGNTVERVYAFSQRWSRRALYSYIAEWRFHNSKEK
ncbi:MAG: hypothetical protein JRJ45_00440 [Deltaproteobacteria bacterium]|nr:hypothetical protein [Deltaproteobacteria bacterium]